MALRRSGLKPVIVMIAEARQTGWLPMPDGVDFVTLPALRKVCNGSIKPRFLEVSNKDIIKLRSRLIRSAIKAFKPDALIVDHLPLGAAGELGTTLERLRRHGETRCVLGLRDVLQDAETVRATWAQPDTANAIRDFYDAIWIYGDRAVYDHLREYGLVEPLASKARYTGYLDQRVRLEVAGAQGGQLLANLPPGRLALCVVGGGSDGGALAEAFARAELPADMAGLIVTGPYMAPQARQRLARITQRRARMTLLDFVPEPASLIDRADRVIAMGGYNTICEMLSFEKHALIVPRVRPKLEQWIRAERIRELGLLEVLHPDKLSPQALAEWLLRDLGPPPPSRSRVDLGGLDRIPALLSDLITRPSGRVAVEVSANVTSGTEPLRNEEVVHA
jgi:predicted glycosyltransferase